MIFNCSFANWYFDDQPEISAALKAGAYDIYFRYDADREEIHYYGFLKADSGLPMVPKLLYLPVCRNGIVGSSALAEDSLLATGVKPFYEFISNNEKKASEDSIKRVYGDDFESLNALRGLSNSEYEKRKAIRLDFLSLVNEFQTNEEKIAPETATSRNGLLVAVDSDYGEQCFAFLFFVPEGSKKETPIGNGPAFLGAMASKGDYKVRSTCIPAYPEAYRHPYDKVLGILARSLTRTNVDPYRSHWILLEDEDVVDLAFALAGEKAEFFNVKGVVPSPLAGSLSIDPSGKLNVEPGIDNEGLIFCHFSGRRVLLAYEKRLKVIEFPNKALASVYCFLTQHGVNSYNYVKDLFPKHVLPAVGAAMLDKGRGEGEMGISLYVALDEKDEGILEFKTVYSISGEEATLERFLSNEIGKGLCLAYRDRLKECGGKENGRLEKQEDVLFFLGADLSRLKQTAKVLVDERLSRLKKKSLGKIKISTQYHTDWLSVSLASAEYSQEQLNEVLSAYRKKKKFVILGDDIIDLSDPNIEKLNQLSEDLQLNEKLGNEKLPLFDAFSLKEYEGGDFEVSYSEALKNALGEIASYKEREVKIPAHIEKELRAYQKEAVQWMDALSSNGLFGILADDMGLGKTLETIAFIASSKLDGPVLIVSPKGLIYNWAAEFRKWHPEMGYHVIDGPKSERLKAVEALKKGSKDAFMVSYDSLRNDIEAYKGVNIGLLVIDEAQYIKNSGALKSKAVKEIKAMKRFALTGTPIENSLTDLWSIFEFLMPGYLPKEDEFAARYIGDGKEKEQTGLQIRVKPFILRRSKEMVLSSLPPKIVSTITVSLDKKQRMLYEGYMEQARALSSSGEMMRFLGMLTRIREICVDPSSFLDDYEEVSDKLQVATMMVQEAVNSGHKILVFSSFVKVLDHLRFLLDGEGIRTYAITGNTSASLRVEMADRFNSSDDVKVMLVSLKAGGTGLNLYGADTVIHLDPWWNQAAENQATDRAHRIGQTRTVNVFKLICHDTIEEKVVLLQQRKQELFDSFVKEGEKGVASLSKEDLEFLLS